MKPAGRALGPALAAGIALAVAASQRPVGFVRDEGYYFAAAARAEAWLLLLARDPAGALSSTERFFAYNFEHPGLPKILFAASHLVFSRGLDLLSDTAAWRLPAFVFAGLLALFLFQLGSARSRAAGVLAPLLFFCAERPFFHAHLAAFDVPICALTAGVGVAWARALGLLGGESRGLLRDRVALGLMFGCALSVKHNAWVLPPVLLAHALLMPAALRSRALRALPFLLLGPLVLFASWPLLWHDPLRHLEEWVFFHTHHVHYAWWYLGDLLRRPPFPIAYPLVVDALALPATTVAILGAALARLLADFLRRRTSPLRLLELGLSAAAILPFLLRTTPIFGGIKHWLAFLALLCPEGADLVVRAARGAAGALRGRGLDRARALVTAACAALAPGLYQIGHVHPYGTSAYGELASGIPGAASLGMQRQFWSNNATGVLPWINAHAPSGARVYLHEVNPESVVAYKLEGLLRRDLQAVQDVQSADYAALQWHREFREVEPETWNAFGTRRPATGLYLDEVPLVVVYVRPGLPGAR